VVVTAINAGGSTPATSAQTAAIAASGGGGGATAAPASSGLPAISGSAQTGQTLSASAGTWSNSPTAYSYQWYRESTPISGATASTYTVTAADVDHTLDVSVTASNSAGTSTAASSASTGVVVNPCDIVDTTASQATADVQNTANSGKTICLRAGTYSISSLTVHQSAMTTLQAYPGDAQPTLSGAPTLRADNLRIEGFHLTDGLSDYGSGTVKIVGNYYHDVNPGGALWFASTSDTPNSTVSELHNRVVNVLINDSSFNDGWGMYGCDVSGQHYIQDYNTFQTMNQHPLQLSGCASIEAIGNEYLDIYDQYSDQHVDCVEIWGGAGSSVLKDNRCTDTAAHPGRSNDFLLSGDSGPFTVINNLIVNSPKQCLDDTPNGTYNGSMKNGDIENNTIVGCNYGAIDMSGGNSSGNTVKYNIAGNITGNGSCSQFTVEDYNAAPSLPNCGGHDVKVTPQFTSTAPSNPNATYQTTNVNPAWGYHAARVGSDAHLPTP
jgi:hypothetical protein